MTEFVFKPVTTKPQKAKPDLRDVLGVNKLVAGATSKLSQKGNLQNYINAVEQSYTPPKAPTTVGQKAVSTQKFLFPTRNQVFQDKQTEAKQSLIPSQKVLSSVAKTQSPFALPVTSGAQTKKELDKFLTTKTFEPDAGFGGLTRRVSSKVSSELVKQTDRLVISKILQKEVPNLDKKTLDALANTISRKTNQTDIERVINTAAREAETKVQETATKKFTVDKPPTPGPNQTVVYYNKTGGQVQNVALDPNVARQWGDNIEIGVVDNAKLKSTGLAAKEDGGVRLIDRSVADALEKTNRAVAPQERKFITAAKKVFPDNAKLNGSYFTRSTDALAAEARALVDESPDIARDIILKGTDERSVAIASEYLNKLGRQAAATQDLAEKARIDEEAATIANDIAEKLTELGRGVQAASLFNRLTPEGQLRTIAKNIKDYNRKNPDKVIPELDGKQAKEILDEARRIQAIADPEQRAIEWNTFQRNNQNLFPTPMLNKITTVWKAGLLTGIKTSGLNLFSNASHFLTESLKQYPASLADALASTVTGKRTTTATQRGIIKGLKEGKIKGKRYFFTGFDERNVGEKLDYNRVNFNNKVFQVYTDTVFRTLGASDQPFYYAASARSMFDQALAQAKTQGLKGKERMKFVNDLVEDPTEEMYHYASIDATTAVFQNKTNLGKVAKAFQNIPYIGQFLVPFAQTPSAVAMQIINYSPIGAVSETVKQIAKGKFDQRLWSQAIGRSTVGTIPLYLGYKLAESGMVKLDYPQGDERTIELDKAEGAAYNSIKIGDKWRSPIVLGPAGNLVLMGAYFQKTINEDGSPAEAMANAAAGLWESFTEQTFLTGIKNFVEGATDIKSGGVNYINNLIASFIPTIVSDVARSKDPLERQSGASVVSRVAARIPGARESLLPQTNILGQPIERKGNVLETMLDPTRPSKDVSTPITKELRRLMDEGYNASPTKLGNKSGYDSLSGTQNTRLWQLTGGIVEDKLNMLFITPEYKNATDEQKTKVIQRVTEMSQNVARAQMLAELTQGMNPQEAKPILEKHKESKLLNETVFKIYMQIR